jgi:hypothetical protein
MKRNHLYHTGRRYFFKKAAYLGAAAVVAGTRAKRGAAAETKPAPVPRTRGNYRMTAHVRRYYERAALI